MSALAAPNRPVWWSDFPATAFLPGAATGAIAVLPIAATEQHGPHLPLATDTAIMAGMLEAVAGLVPAELDLRILPIQTVGKSDEHVFAPGTLTLPATLLVEAWTALGAAVARAGISKLVIVNAHGGNEEVMGIVARALRVQCGMLVAKTSWMRFGYPEGLYPPAEIRQGVHGGDIETSLMLHFRPDLVDMTLAADFHSRAAAAEAEHQHLRPTGTHAFAWIATDLHPSGAVGNAAAATAAKGAATAAHQARGFVELLTDMARADPARLLAAP